MTWTRFDDGWGDRPDVLSLSLPARWHLSELIRWCSRTKRYDGRIRTSDARRCSDVDDPDGVLAEIRAAGHLTFDEEESCYFLVRIDEHVPPPHMRDEHRKAGQRERQQRRRERLATEEPVPAQQTLALASVTRDITGDPRTGQDGGACSSSNEDEQAPKSRSRKPAASAPPLFDEFWEAWPRKISKAEARKKYGTAVARGADPSLIVQAAKDQAEQWHREGKEVKFIPHAATWLNQARYEDTVERSELRLVSNSDSPWGTWKGPESPWAQGWG